MKLMRWFAVGVHGCHENVFLTSLSSKAIQKNFKLLFSTLYMWRYEISLRYASTSLLFNLLLTARSKAKQKMCWPTKIRSVSY